MINKFEKSIDKKYEVDGKKFLARIVVNVNNVGALSTSIFIFKIDNEKTGAQTVIVNDSLDDIFQVETFYDKEWVEISQLHSKIERAIHEYINSYLIGEKNIEHVTQLLNKMEE